MHYSPDGLLTMSVSSNDDQNPKERKARRVSTNASASTACMRKSLANGEYGRSERVYGLRAVLLVGAGLLVLARSLSGLHQYSKTE
jgi:hypothetical protein